jgi:hypothetical protein
MARQGKIARLPLSVREQLNARLMAGEPASKVLPWLNALPETKRILDEDFEGLLVSDQNLSEWRKGGYQEWLKRRERLDHTRELAQYSVKLARANGGSITEGAIAIASGYILELLEACDGKLDPETATELITGLAKLQASDAAAQRADLDREKLKRKDEEIALAKKKFQRETGELFIKWHEDKRAKDILGQNSSHAEKLNRIGELMFGADWNANIERPTATQENANAK